MDTSPTRGGSRSLTTYRKTWVAIGSVVLVLCGAIMLVTLGPLPSLIVVASMAGLGALVGGGVAFASPDAASSAISFAMAAASATVTAFGIAGVPWIFGPAAILLLATSPPVVQRLMMLTSSQGAAIRPSTAHADHLAKFTARLETLDTDQLRELWAASTVELARARSPRAVNDVVKVRHLCLDELERREPETFNLWLLTQYPG